MLLNLEPVPGPRQPAERTSRAGSQGHRRELVRRLLAEGLSPEALVRLLPEWRELIRSVADEQAAADTG